MKIDSVELKCMAVRESQYPEDVKPELRERFRYFFPCKSLYFTHHQTAHAIPKIISRKPIPCNALYSSAAIAIPAIAIMGER